MYFRHYVEELGDPKRPISTARLTNLSALAGEELVTFRQEWGKVDVERRQQVVRRLLEVAEDNPELDFEEVFKVCLADADAKVRKGAIEGLWDSTDRTLIAPLVGLVQADPSTSVRESAVQALGRFMMAAEAKDLRPRDAARVEAALMGVIGNESEPASVRRRAVEAVGASSQSRVVTVIEEVYRSPDAQMRASAIYAMGRNCDLRWLPLLLKELESDDPEMRFEAAGAVGELGDMRAVPPLVSLLQDDDVQVQLAAIGALGSIGGPLAKRSLQRCLRHPEERVREAAEEALKELQFSEDPLTFGLGD